MATTPSNNLPYPDDYADPADTPAVVEALALATDAALNLRAMAARRINTTAPLTGGGDLTTDRTFAITPGYYARVYVQATQPSAGNIGDIWVPT
jgi:hypothetical protein